MSLSVMLIARLNTQTIIFTLRMGKQCMLLSMNWRTLLQKCYFRQFKLCVPLPSTKRIFVLGKVKNYLPPHHLIIMSFLINFQLMFSCLIPLFQHHIKLQTLSFSVSMERMKLWWNRNLELFLVNNFAAQNHFSYSVYLMFEDMNYL